ncbi:MAG: hypothetical protein AAGI90_07220 [Chlamydiota bacterium]
MWKLRKRAPWEEFPSELCALKAAYHRLNRRKKVAWEFFLIYEEKSIQNRHLPKEVVPKEFVSALHQDASGARHGASREGWTFTGNQAYIKSGHGNLVDFEITRAQGR